MPFRKVHPISQPSPLSVDVSKEEPISLTPTLVILWSHNGEVVSNLKKSLARRLAIYSEIGALHWAGPLLPGQKITGEDIARACKPLLSWDLWQRLAEKGYRSDLPAPGSPAQIRVILVVDRMTSELDGPPSGIMREMQKCLKGQAELSSVLIWLGEKPEPPPEDLNLYWPRIRMEPVAAGGITVGPNLVWEATEHLLVALMSSAFVPAVNRMVQKKKVEWLVTGASALLLHPDLEEWVYESVLREILAPLIAPLPEMERDRIEKAMSQHAQNIRKALREETEAALREMGWEIQFEGSAVQQCFLKKEALLEALFGDYRGGVTSRRLALRDWKHWPKDLWTMISALAQPHLPDVNLGKILYQHYQELGEQVEQWLSSNKWRGLAPRALEEYRDLRIFLGALLDRGIMSKAAPEKRPSWWFVERPLPTGLSAALMALFSLEKHLCEEGDLEDARKDTPGPHRGWVRPEPLNTRAYLQAAGETDAAIVRGDLLRYAHFARTLASPWGVLLYLLPAWPLAAFLAQSVENWQPAQAVLVTGLVLLAIGIAELIYWWLIKARRLLKAVQKKAHHYLGSRILRLVAGGLRDYRHWMLTRLWEAEFALADLYSICLRRYAETEKASWALEEFRPQVKGSTYIFALNREEIQKWKDQAREAIHHPPEQLRERATGKGFDSAVTALIVQEVWPLSEQPMPGEEMLKNLETLCREKVRETAPPLERWKAGIPAEDVDLLKGGKRWEWLWNHAHPLGRVESPTTEFTIMIASAEVLSGPTGKGSPYWRPEWQTVSTLQSGEEVCIRWIIEPKRGA